MKALLNDHFAVVVVLFVFVLLFGAYILEIHLGHSGSTLDWLEGEMKEIIGAILMGLTGTVRSILNGSRKTDSPETK